MNYYRNKKVTIMGLGLFGGGLEAAKFFAKNGSNVIVTDLKDKTTLSKQIKSLSKFNNIKFTIGKHLKKDFINRNLLVINPAVPLPNQFISLAKNSGAKLTSEMNIFIKHCPAPIIGITGSNGKSTTTALCHKILQSIINKSNTPPFSNVFVGGNIGKPLINKLNKIKKNDIVILEMSSFQLEHLKFISKSPSVSLITNIYENHLDRHKTIKKYATSKLNIFKFQNKNDIKICGESPILKKFIDLRDITLVNSGKFRKRNGCYLYNNNIILYLNNKSLEIIKLNHIKLKGIFNAENVSSAICCIVGALLLKYPPSETFDFIKKNLNSIKHTIKNFNGVEHRLEFAGKFNNIEFYNDSIATDPLASSRALSVFNKPIILIAGGYNKNLSFAPLKVGDGKIKTAILIGKAAPDIENALRKFKHPPEIINMGFNFKNALLKAIEKAPKGSIVLLAPACASYDMFDNFQQRGNLFKRIVRNYYKY